MTAKSFVVALSCEPSVVVVFVWRVSFFFEFRVSSCQFRVSSWLFRVSSYHFRVSSCYFRVSSCHFWVSSWANFQTLPRLSRNFASIVAKKSNSKLATRKIQLETQKWQLETRKTQLKTRKLQLERK